MKQKTPRVSTPITFEQRTFTILGKKPFTALFFDHKRGRRLTAPALHRAALQAGFTPSLKEFFRLLGILNTNMSEHAFALWYVLEGGDDSISMPASRQARLVQLEGKSFDWKIEGFVGILKQGSQWGLVRCTECMVYAPTIIQVDGMRPYLADNDLGFYGLLVSP